MVSKKAILDNVLLREILSARIDTLWKMLELKRRGLLPASGEEGATGKFDNKGAIFVPGGLVFQDVDEAPIRYTRRSDRATESFSRQVREAMRSDNATLLYPDGMASGINLDSGFFSRAARRIMTYKKAAFRRKKKIGRKLPRIECSDDMIRSHCPSYIEPPYGARMRISSCLAVGLAETPMFFAYCRAELNLDENRMTAFAAGLDRVREPVLAKNGTVLFPPHVVVCHDTRYKENALTGLTRILGLGKFGEFATLTLEETTAALVGELKRKGVEAPSFDTVAKGSGTEVLCILRIYAPTNPGRRSASYTLHVVSPSRDLGIDVARIEADAKRRYRWK